MEIAALGVGGSPRSRIWMPWELVVSVGVEVAALGVGGKPGSGGSSLKSRNNSPGSRSDSPGSWW